MQSIHRFVAAAFGRPRQRDFQPSQGNRRRVEIYDELILLAQMRAEKSETIESRREHLQLIARLDARCKREVQRREDAARSLGNWLGSNGN